MSEADDPRNSPEIGSFLIIRERPTHKPTTQKLIEDLLSGFDEGLIASARFFMAHGELIDLCKIEKVPTSEANLIQRFFKDSAAHTNEVEAMQFHTSDGDTNWGVVMYFDPKLRANPVIPNRTFFVSLSGSLLPALKTEWISTNRFLHPSYRSGDTLYYRKDRLNPGVYSKVVLETEKGRINRVEVLERDELEGFYIMQRVQIDREPRSDSLSEVNTSRLLSVLQPILSHLPFERMPLGS